ncbi:MAG TPA: glutamate mutase L, partial [Chloroflexia bacterium]|nr:glutamate mutase L [Chloroflexia bacterium]
MDNATGAMPEAPTVATVGATLAVDIGSLYTRAALFDVVGDEYRFIARAVAITTTEAPYNDVTSGVYNAIMELEQITGRKLTEETRLLMPQRRDGNGLDLFIATSSAAPALRLMLAAVSSDISQVSALQAVQSTYTHIVGRITLDEGLHEIPSEDDALLSTAATAWFQEQTDKLLALPPDVVLIAG